MARHPNVLWIMTDQHRADCLGCMGHPVMRRAAEDVAATGHGTGMRLCPPFPQNR